MLLALLMAVLLALSAPLRSQDLTFFTVGSGELGGGYYVAAAALCDAVNRAEHGAMRCSPEPTSGSLYNLATSRSTSPSPSRTGSATPSRAPTSSTTTGR